MCLPGCQVVMDYVEWGEEDEQNNNNERKMIRRPLPTDTDKWNSLPPVPKHAEMGYLHLSFEYHKGALKVRVWQISDLLLPPPQISMIHSIFVRGYFLPDQARKTHRHTEEIVLDALSSGGPTENPKTGIQHIFTPSSFKFRMPLLYTGVTGDIVKERSLQLEVCMTQKRSHRTFLMAMVHMPLRTAVRRPIREKYPLIPCMNVTIPNNMRVYSAVDLQLESSHGDFSRVNGVTRNKKSDAKNRNSLGSPLSPDEVELEDVVSLSAEDFLRSHLSLCLDDSDDDDFGESNDSGKLREVRVANGVGSSGASSSTTLDVPSSGEENDDDDIHSVITNGHGRRGNGASVDMSGAARSSVKKKIIPNELLKHSLSDDSLHVAVDMPSEHTVLNLGEDDRASVKPVTEKEKTSPDSKPSTRKKIIPAELHSPNTSSDVSVRVEEDSYRDVSTVSEDSPTTDPSALQPELKSVPEKPQRKKKIHVLPGELSIPSDSSLSSPRRLAVPHSSSSSEGLSPRETSSPRSGRRGGGGSKGEENDFSPLQDSAFTPASRPETPCWDFYDFSEDLKADDLDLEMGGRSLEESLDQLRQHGIGSLQNLSKEPILPMDLKDDFDSLAVESEEVEEAADNNNHNKEET